MKDRFLDWFAWKFLNPYGVNMPGGNCPVQSEGVLTTGEFYYFRARGTAWSMDIAIDEKSWLDQIYLYRYRDAKYATWPEAGWLPKRKCIKLANWSIEQYYKSKSI